ASARGYSPCAGEDEKPDDQRSPGSRTSRRADAGRSERRIAVLDREPRELRVVAEPQLLQHVTAMGIDGLDADLEVLGDLAIGQATREHLHDLRFTRGQRARGMAIAGPEQLFHPGRNDLL